jgi:hypothetical protein
LPAGGDQLCYQPLNKNRFKDSHRAALPALQLVLATGKAMGPWVADVVPRLGSRLPQIYLQVRQGRAGAG